MTTPSTPAAAAALPTPPGRNRSIASRIIGNLVQAGMPRLSPDGCHVAFVVTQVDESRNLYRSQVWLASTDGSQEARALTAGDHDGQPAWSPDGSTLAFVSRRGEKTSDATLHALSIHGVGELRTLATMPDGIGDVAFSPEGHRIAFTSRTRDTRYDAADDRWQPPRRIERFFSRMNGEGWVFDRPSHVYVVDAAGLGAPQNLTPGPFQHSGVAWTPDGRAIITAAQRHETWDLDFAEDLYSISVDADHPGGVVGLTAHTGCYSRPAVAPDGSAIAFIGHDDPDTDPQNDHVGLVGAGADAYRWLTRALDRTFFTTAGAAAPVWLDDSTLLATAEDRGETHLYRVSVDGSAPVALTSGALTVKDFDAAAGTVAMCIGTATDLADIFVIDADTPGGRPRRLTHFADRYRRVGRPLGWERFAVPTTDGTAEIDAWIMRPAGFDSGSTYPTILNVHGGPHTQYGETFFDEAQLQAAAGFVVLMCNPRGGSGREEVWGQAIVGPKHPRRPGSGWGSVDVADVLGVVDHAVSAFPFIDAGRLGMQGGSYGGYMATWLAGTTGSRFRAICSERAVNNLITEEFTSDISTVFRIQHGPTHLDDPDEYTRMSPIRFVREIEVPILIVHSENDLRCPISQAEELFVALRLLGKDVTFYRFPGEDHELSRSGSPVHRVQRAEIILDWFTEKLAV